MRFYKAFGFSFILLLLCYAISYGQYKVFIQSTAEDNIGTRLVYQIKESIRASHSMVLWPIEDSSFVQIRIATLDPDNNGVSTVYSIVWTVSQPPNSSTIYLSNMVGTCGINKINSVAETLVADTDNLISQFVATFATLMELLKQAKQAPQSPPSNAQQYPGGQ